MKNRLMLLLTLVISSAWLSSFAFADAKRDYEFANKIYHLLREHILINTEKPEFAMCKNYFSLAVKDIFPKEQLDVRTEAGIRSLIKKYIFTAGITEEEYNKIPESCTNMVKEKFDTDEFRSLILEKMMKDDLETTK